MPHELTATPAAPANGHAPPAESPLDRVRRVLRGDIHPSDYLAVPPDLAARIENELRLAVGLKPGRTLGDRERMSVWQDRILTHHHDGAVVAVIRREEGVIVVAVGLDEIGRLSRQLPEWGGQVIVEFPFSGFSML